MRGRRIVIRRMILVSVVRVVGDDVADNSSLEDQRSIANKLAREEKVSICCYMQIPDLLNEEFVELIHCAARERGGG